MKRFDPSSLYSASTARTYNMGVEKLHTVIEEAIESLSRWTLTGSSQREVRAIRTTRIFGFEDDVTVRLTQMQSGAHTNTWAEFKSTSRIGIWDLGQNGRNLKELIVMIDQELTAEG